jgi:putative alpha-1,2-mannosidase
MPFGMVKRSPDNQRQGWKAGYEYRCFENIAGFSHIHSWTMDGLLMNACYWSAADCAGR